MSRKVIRHRRKLERRSPPGSPPGLLTVDPSSPRPVVRAMAYGPEGIFEADVTAELDKVPQLLRDWPVIWINVDGLGDAETIRRIGEIFHLHPLALEDAISVHQRAKVEQYPDHLFVVARMMELHDRLLSDQLSLFVGKGFVVTFQETAGDSFDPVRDRLRRGKGRLRTAGSDFLAYSLIDAVVDAYFPIIEAYGERLEEIEDEVILRPSRTTIVRVHEIKRELLVIRRAIWPLREAINTFFREPSSLISDETRLHLRDCYDHTIQVIDLCETYRELGSGLMETYLSSIGNRTNEVMKVLTIIATIFIPLTFIAGLYGMNFKTEKSPLNMPELDWYWGYPFCLAVMAVVAGGMLFFFWRRGWLGSGGVRLHDSGAEPTLPSSTPSTPPK
jgi:magnesium transporter